MSVPFIPQRTIEALATEHPDGTRHHAKILIGLPLIGNGLPPSAVEQTLRAKFPQATAREISDVVRWCVAKSPTPSGYGPAPVNGARLGPILERKPVLEKLIGNDSFDESGWLEISKKPVPTSAPDQAMAFLTALYHEGEFLCGVVDHGLKPDGRCFPTGAGHTATRETWLERIAAKGMWQSKAGAWWRINPLKAATGSGSNGATTDADVSAFRYALVEHDKLPIAGQHALLRKLLTFGLSIAAVLTTGGKSLHAYVRLDAASEADYSEKIDRLLRVTQPLGFDSNRNPSRLARVPGVTRTIGASGDGQQRLLYLDPDPNPLDWQRFENSASPIDRVVSGKDLIARIREWMRPKDRGFTLPFLVGKEKDDGFYFRDAEMTLWTGVTSHGKSTILRQTMGELLAEEVPFFVCSLEHTPEDICENMARAVYGRAATEDYAVRFLEMFGHRFFFLDLVGEIGSEDLLSRMQLAHQRLGCRHFFIDSLMRVSGLEEDYPAQTAFMNLMQSFVKETKAHVHLVAHPRKVDETQRVRKMDVKGSNNIANNVDNILAVRRNVRKDEAKEDGSPAAGGFDAELSVEKQRATGWQGTVRLTFNPDARIFTTYAPTLRRHPKTSERHD